MIRTLIIDDEDNSRNHIRNVILENFPQVVIVGEADGVATGIDAIKNHEPELVLLDIRMKDGNAFDLLGNLRSIEFKIIFVTAYEEYALKAIKLSALDYLLKPASVEDLRIALMKAENQILAELKLQLNSLHGNLKTNRNQTIALRTSERIYLIEIADIIHCEADRSYTLFFVQGEKKYIVSQPMKDFEDILKDHGFIRIHKSHLVNTSYIDSFDKTEGGSIILKDGTYLPVSRRKKAEFIDRLTRL